MLYVCHVLYSARGSGDMPPRKFKSYKIESGGNFSPTIMVIAKNAHYPWKVRLSEIDCESNYKTIMLKLFLTVLIIRVSALLQYIDLA